MVTNSTNFGHKAGSAALIIAFAAACSSDDAPLSKQSANDAGAGTAGSSGTGGSSGTAGSGDAGPDAGAATHSGLLSIQDMSIHGSPELGHGLTVQIIFTPAKPPDYEELPGQLTGCKAWVYDVASKPAPAPSDQGVVTISGLFGGSFECRFEAPSGYACPTWTGSGQTAVTLGPAGTAEYSIAGARFSEVDVGRYLEISSGQNRTAFPIVAAPSATTLTVLNPGASASEFSASFRVLAGAGPVPNNPRDPIGQDDRVTIGIAPGGERNFDFPDVGPITPGGEFVLNDASQAILAQLPLGPEPITLSCSGPGGHCAPAQATVVRLSTTDGSTAGAPATAMPAPARSQVELQCGTLGGDGSLTIPAEAMALIASSHRSSPITRIRIAYMREGLGIAANPAGSVPNGARALVGHGVLAFVKP